MTGAGIVSAARRVLPAVLIFLLVIGLVALLSGLHVPLTDAAARKNYGTFTVGLAAALLVTRLLDFTLFDVGYRLRRGTAAPALLRQLVSLFVFVVFVAVLFQVVLSANLAAILTTSAIITAVIGLALQETLGNLFSGLALALERTVQVGDMVRAGDSLGLVEELSWRAIKVRTMEGNSLLIPNTVASRDRLEVFRRSGVPMARTLVVGLEYSAPPARARAILEGAAKDVPGVTAHPSPVAYLHRFGDFAVLYELRYWLDDYARFLEIDSKVRERLWHQLEREGLKIAYPIIRQYQYAAGPLLPPADDHLVPTAIAGNQFFAPLSSAERATLAERARRRRYADGEIVVREGDTTSSMFLIATGRVAISIHAETGSSQKLAILEPGDAFGEISLLTGEPRLATARAMSETTLMEIEKDTLAPILRANPSLVEKLDAIVQERRQNTANLMEKIRDESAEPVSLRKKIPRFFGLKGLAE